MYALHSPTLLLPCVLSFALSCVQALTSRPVKGMLTGPVTILNW